MRATLCLLLFLVAGFGGRACAHSASSSYLRIDADGSRLAVQWSIALRDLEYAVGLDTNGDGAITWGELRGRTAAVEAYALARLRLTEHGDACPPGPVTLQADRLGDGTYAVLEFIAQCPRPARQVGVHYTLLFDLDRLHRGLLNLTMDGTAHAQVLSPAQSDVTVSAAGGYGATIAQFFSTGMEHLLSGIDHMLFVTMLLVPAVFRGRGRGRTLVPVDRLSRAFLEAIKLLSVFTLAHGTTLTLSVLHIVSIPQRVSEPGIALTIMLTAADNIWPFLPGRRWQLAFAFGLIHGLGFANALGPLSLPPLQLAAALLSFNLGLDAAQISIAAVILPLTFAMRNTIAYPRRIMPGLSGAVALLAVAWFADRAANLGLMPF